MIFIFVCQLNYNKLLYLCKNGYFFHFVGHIEIQISFEINTCLKIDEGQRIIVIKYDNEIAVEINLL